MWGGGMRKRLLGLVAAGLALALVLAGCGPQAKDEDDVQVIEDDDEQVYIFPDGTQVGGEEARWMKQTLARLYPPERMNGRRMVNEEAVRSALGEQFVQFTHPATPSRFHFVGYTLAEINGNVSVSAYWASPESKEWIAINVQKMDGQTQHFTSPICEDWSESEGSKAIDVPPGGNYGCFAEVIVPGWYVHLWMKNVPETDAISIASSVRDKVFSITTQ